MYIYVCVCVNVTFMAKKITEMNMFANVNQLPLPFLSSALNVYHYRLKKLLDTQSNSYQCY